MVLTPIFASSDSIKCCELNSLTNMSNYVELNNKSRAEETLADLDMTFSSYDNHVYKRMGDGHNGGGDGGGNGKNDQLHNTFHLHSKRGKCLYLTSYLAIFFGVLGFFIDRLMFYWDHSKNSSTKVNISTEKNMQIPVMGFGSTSGDTSLNITDAFIDLVEMVCVYYGDDDLFFISLINPTSTDSSYYYDDYGITVVFKNLSWFDLMAGNDSNFLGTLNKEYNNIGKSNFENKIYVIEGGFGISFVIPILDNSYNLLTHSNGDEYDASDYCAVDLNITSIAFISSTTSYDSVKQFSTSNEHYLMWLTPLTQFLDDGINTKYWTNIEAEKQAFTMVDVSTTTVVNHIENTKIQFLSVEDSSYYSFSVETFNPIKVSSTTNGKYDIYIMNYQQYALVEPDSYGLEFKYTTHELINAFDVFSSTGGAFKMIASTVVTILVLYIYGFYLDCSWCQKTCQCSWCCWNRITTQRMVYEGYAPYQKMSRPQQKQLMQYLKSNGYYSWQEIKPKFEQMERKIAQLENKLREASLDG